MGAVMWLSFYGSASLNVAEGRESTARQTVEDFYYMFVVSLVVGYEYCFHEGLELSRTL